jgi:hypothetical protein
MLEQANKQSAATNLQSTIANLEQQFGAKNPDYADAVAFLKDRRMAMYAAMGLDEAAQAKTYQDEATWLVTNALKSGRNPAEAAYEMAKLTGFAGKSAPNGQNGAAQAANPAPQAKTPAEKQLDAVREGLSNASLSNSGGVKSSEMPIEAILAMNERDFGDYLDKLTSAQWEKLARSVEKAAKA